MGDEDLGGPDGAVDVADPGAEFGQKHDGHAGRVEEKAGGGRLGVVVLSGEQLIQLDLFGRTAILGAGVDAGVERGENENLLVPPPREQLEAQAVQVVPELVGSDDRGGAFELRQGKVGQDGGIRGVDVGAGQISGASTTQQLAKAGVGALAHLLVKNNDVRKPVPE